MQKKGKSRRSSAASPQEVGKEEEDGCKRGDGESPPTLQLTSGKEQVQQPDTEDAGVLNGGNCKTPDLKCVEKEKMPGQDELLAAKEEEKTMIVDVGHRSGIARSPGRLREHHSDVDLRRADLVESRAELLRQPLGRSLSEGSRHNLPLTPLNVRNSTCQLLPEVNQPTDGSHSCKSQGAKEEEEQDHRVASNDPPKGSPVQSELSATQSIGCDVL